MTESEQLAGQPDDDKPAVHMEEEPQDERGAPGSRDEGHPPGEGPADRPEGTTGDDTSVDSQGTDHQDMPHMPSS